MEEPSQLERNQKLIEIHRARKLLEEAERLLAILPQGHESTLDADKIDGLHAAEIIAKAVAEVVAKVTQKMRVGGGGGISGIGVDSKIAAHTAIEDAHINHLLYLLLDGTRAMTGDLDLGGNSLIMDDLEWDNYTANWCRLVIKGTTTVKNVAFGTVQMNAFTPGTNLFVFRTTKHSAGRVYFQAWGAGAALVDVMDLRSNNLGYIDILRGGDITMLASKTLDLATNSAEFKPRRVSVSAEPTPTADTLEVWRDPDDNKTYLIYNDTDEGVRKVEMT